MLQNVDPLTVTFIIEHMNKTECEKIQAHILVYFTLVVCWIWGREGYEGLWCHAAGRPETEANHNENEKWVGGRMGEKT